MVLFLFSPAIAQALALLASHTCTIGNTIQQEAVSIA
jgi:hypothetical protein